MYIILFNGYFFFLLVLENSLKRIPEECRRVAEKVTGRLPANCRKVAAAVTSGTWAMMVDWATDVGARQVG